jgi:hypothetical protein
MDADALKTSHLNYIENSREQLKYVSCSSQNDPQFKACRLGRASSVWV